MNALIPTIIPPPTLAPLKELTIGYMYGKMCNKGDQTTIVYDRLPITLFYKKKLQEIYYWDKYVLNRNCTLIMYFKNMNVDIESFFIKNIDKVYYPTLPNIIQLNLCDSDFVNLPNQDNSILNCTIVIRMINSPILNFITILYKIIKV